MGNCVKCKRIDIKCCITCAKDSSKCEVWHHCGQDCPEWQSGIMTNADRIRRMTDEELAEFIADITYYCRGRQNRNHCHECSLQKCGACNEICIGEWLKSEVEK